MHWEPTRRSNGRPGSHFFVLQAQVVQRNMLLIASLSPRPPHWSHFEAYYFAGMSSSGERATTQYSHCSQNYLWHIRIARRSKDRIETSCQRIWERPRGRDRGRSCIACTPPNPRLSISTADHWTMARFAESHFPFHDLSAVC